MATYGSLLAEAEALLTAAGVDGPRRDAALLLAQTVGVAPHQIGLYGEREVSPEQEAVARQRLGRRAQREPVSRILGERGFWSLDFTLSAETLDPRPDSETVIEMVLAAEPNRQAPLTILDLGTGTGCLLLSILAEYPQARGVGLDCAAGAVATAQENARRNDAAGRGLWTRSRFVVADWTEAGWQDCLQPERGEVGFDLVVSNPPYIPLGERESLAPEVRDYDPARALFAGDDGLEDYRRLCRAVPEVVRPGGLVVFEIGKGQQDDVRSLLVNAGADPVWERADLGGIVRCLAGRRNGR